MLTDCVFEAVEDKLLWKRRCKLVNKPVCVCVSVLFDENRQTAMTNCPREQILLKHPCGSVDPDHLLTRQHSSVFFLGFFFTKDWSHSKKANRFVWAHFIQQGKTTYWESDYEQQWQKHKSAPGQHQVPRVCLSGRTLWPFSTCICTAVMIMEQQEL